MFIPRHISSVVEKVAKTFPVTIISGARQIGKTTLLLSQHPQSEYLTFDKLDVLQAAQNAPERFVEALRSPTIIDEVQYCPDIFRYIKLGIDSGKFEKGSLFLTGSQRFQMMENVDESLAGRAGIIQMLGLSLREISLDNFTEPFIPTQEYIAQRKAPALKEDIWEIIFRGDLPELTADKEMDPAIYYQSYIETYLRRDVRDLAHVGDLSKFNRFLKILAFEHGHILNKTSLSSACDTSFATIERWLSILEASDIIYFLKPFVANAKKRLVKSPKLYFMNSGLAASLCGYESAEDLCQSDVAGEFFEGFVISEIVKSFLNHDGRLPDLYYYRDSNGREIDAVIENGKRLYPIEIKKAEIARPSDAKTFKDLDAFSGYERQEGAVICLLGSSASGKASALPLTDDAWALPVTYI